MLKLATDTRPKIFHRPGSTFLSFDVSTVSIMQNNYQPCSAQIWFLPQNFAQGKSHDEKNLLLQMMRV